MTTVFNSLGFKVLKLFASPMITNDIATSILVFAVVVSPLLRIFLPLIFGESGREGGRSGERKSHQ